MMKMRLRFLTTSVKTFRGFLHLRKITQNSAKGDRNAKKVTIKSVTFTYQGTEDDFFVFLKAIVRDYLTADDPAQPAAEAFVGKVESGAA